MSEKQEHRKRYLQHLEFIAQFNKWLDREPSVWRLRAWRRWKSERPEWRYDR